MYTCMYTDHSVGAERSKVTMVKQQRRTDRCFLPAAARVRFPVSRVQRRSPLTHQVLGRKWAESGTGCSFSTKEEDRGDDGRSQHGDVGSNGSSGEAESKRARVDRNEEAAAPTNREKLPVSCGQPGSGSSSTDGVPPPDQKGAAELSEDSRAAELQSVGSLKVTIQQSSESREFGPTDRQTGGLHCHVCDLTCRSLQVFQEHMSGSEHLRKLKEITHSICLNTHTLQSRRCQPDTQRWCETCQTHFSGDVIIHRRTEQHKMCKQMSRPFCPVCKRHFRTPRKFVEHMKSSEHKQQVHMEEAQEEELITVDAVGCFQEEEKEEKEEEKEEKKEEEEEKEEENEEEKEEEKEEEEKKEEEEVEVGVDEEEDVGDKAEQKMSEAADTQETQQDQYDASITYGSSFVVPVSGFLCQLCNKFFHKETTARHTHCRTHTHYFNLQSFRQQTRLCDSEAAERCHKTC